MSAVKQSAGRTDTMKARRAPCVGAGQTAQPAGLDILLRESCIGMASNAVRLLYKRADGKWAWNLKVNGRVVATDGSQGYENESDARDMAERVISGEFADADRRIRREAT